MIIQCCYLDKYDWLVKVFYEVQPEDTNIILKELDDIECDKIAFYKLLDLFESNITDTGFTYTDSTMHVTFIIICRSSCAEEFRNTFDHEKGHAVMHIAKYYNIDPFGEEIQYLSQDLGSQMFEVAHNFMCNRCRMLKR